jgi:hypothetical protein
MTQIQTPVLPNISQGPRGIGARNAGGVYSQDGQQDIIDGDSFQGPETLLSGTTDAIVNHVAGNYIIKTAGVDAITLFAPTAGIDDGLSINIWSDTANAHTVTLPSAVFASGKAQSTVATFAAFRGAGISLRAFNGVWQVIGLSPGMSNASFA